MFAKNFFKLFAFAILVSSAVCIRAATITVVPSSESVAVASRFIVDIQISDLDNGAASSVGTFDVDLGFDPVLLSFVDATYGTGLDVLGLGSVQFTTPGVGTVNVFELSLDSAVDLNSLQPASFIMTTLTFNALAEGTSPLSLSLNALGDANGRAITDSLQNGTVKIIAPSSVVPEPSIFSFILLTVAGFTGCRFLCR